MAAEARRREQHYRRRRVIAAAIVLVLAVALVMGALSVSSDIPKPGISVPFGSHRTQYAGGTIAPSGDTSTLDAAVVSYYEKWRDTYLAPACGHARMLAVRSPDAAHPYVSEAQGYGMEILVTMAGADPRARDRFDAVLRFVLAHPSKNSAQLTAGAQDSSCTSVDGKNSATDGDLDITYGLLLADKQWGSNTGIDYRQIALQRIAAIKRHDINPHTRLPLLGDWAMNNAKYGDATRPSDFMFDHFRAFENATGDRFWASVTGASQSLLENMQETYAPYTGLVPDFIVDTASPSPRPASPEFLESANDGYYAYNAARVPWHLGQDAAVSGNGLSRIQARRISSWFRENTAGTPAQIRGPYQLDGVGRGPAGDPTFISTVAPAAMLDGADQAWLDTLWSWMSAEAARPQITNYYPASLTLQAMIVVSGNYWAP